jgi:cathepsin L
MKALVGVLALLACAAAFTEKEYETSFTEWMVKYEKSYAPEELFYRFEVYKSTLDWVTNYNAQANRTAEMETNQFADLTPAEFKLVYLGLKPELARGKKISTLVDLGEPTYPGTLDWRSKGAVTPVKNQGQCGSCWAFSTTGSVEGAVAIKHSTLISLSEQSLMDCGYPYGNLGCSGGLMDSAFKQAEAKGIATEASYPYTAKDGTCKTYTASANSKITSYKDVAKQASSVGTAVDLGPVSVAIEADQAAFQNYKSGIISSGCGTSLDHGVLIVGYGTDSSVNKDYWTVKNSWGVTWGEQGYVRIDRAGDVCGILNQASYPVD